jgi:hypothetical protein
LLARVAHRMPQGSALISFSLDSIGGVVVAVSPRAPDDVAAHDGLAGINAATIVSPVTPEQPTAPGQSAARSTLERVTVRFQFARGKP